ncbi:MAG: hypothetical protein GXP21_05510 [Gammaproteobacteria bacterium]|nr:hypothetical protein [Gammaproteobacteria bacterium]
MHKFVSVWLLSLLALSLSVQAEERPDLLWVAQNNAVFGFSKVDNSVVVQIPNLQRTVREVVPDIERDRLWVFSDQGLLAFNLAGQFQQITPVFTSDANTARLEVNPNDGYVWLTAGRRLFVFNQDGVEIRRFTFQQFVSGVSVDIVNDRVWISGNRNIVALAMIDDELIEVDRIRSNRRVLDIAVNPVTGVLWAGVEGRLRRYSNSNGFDLNFQIPFINRMRVAENGDVYLITRRSLVRAFADGPIAFSILPFFGRSGLQDLMIDEATESVWVSRNRRLRQFDFDGSRLDNLRIPRAVRDIAIGRDRNAPEIAFIVPEESDLVVIEDLTLALNISDGVDNINQESVSITVNGEELAVDCTFVDTNIDCLPAETGELVEGPAELTATVEDNAGNLSNTAIVTITLSDAAPLTITLNSPNDGDVVANANINFQGNLNRAATLTLNGEVVTVDAEFNFNQPVTLQEGANNVSLIADDGDEQITLDITITLDTALPSIAITAPSDGLITNEPLLTINGTTTDTDTLTVNDAPVSLTPEGIFSLANTNLIEGENSFTFIATDTNGNTVTEVLIVTLDTIAPQITITSPADGSVTGAETIIISGNLSEPASLTLNGAAVGLEEDNTFSLTDTPLAEGDNTFAFIAIDAAGNQTERSITVSRDSQAPVISISAPQNNSTTNQAEITISGSVAGADELTLNGTTVTLNQNGSFTQSPITLVEGVNSFTLTATDSSGNSAELILTLTLDSITPIITLTSPTDGNITQAASIDIVGSLSEAATLTLNGNAVTLAEDNSFSLPASALTEGANVFTFVATDAAGNNSQVVVTVIRDSAAPIISITTPQDGLVTNQSQIVIQGNVDDAASLTLDGIPTTLASDGSFSTGNIALNEGDNRFTFVATDAAGNSTQTNITITRDSITPVITITEPVDGLVTSLAEQGFSGSLSEVASLTFNGIAIPLASDNSFTIAPIPLNVGANSFTFIATDAANNSSQVIVSVTRDTVGPTITIVSPANNTLTTSESIDITGSVSEISSLTINGAPVVVAGDLSFGVTIPLAEGANTLTLLASDNAGNLGQAILTISRDSAAPNTPVANLINRSNAQSGIISLQGNANSVDVNITVRISNTRTNEVVTVTANSNGSFSAQINGENDDVLSIVAVDAAGNVSAAVTINPPAPVNLTIMPIGNQTALLGQSLSFNVIVMDAEDADIILGISPLPLPQGMSFNDSSGELSYTPTLAQIGSFDLTFMAMTDDEEIEQTVTFTVPEPSGVTGLIGRVVTTDSAPLPGVTLAVDGVTTVSAIDGTFTFNNLNVSGETRLLIDGGTVDRNLGVFAEVPETISLIAGVTNLLTDPVILLPLDIEAADQVVPTQTSIITSSAETGVKS